MSIVKLLAVGMGLLLLAGCGDTFDDLNPSGKDRRPTVEQNVPGPHVGQNAADFTLINTLGESVNLATELSSAKGVVLYFNMWCPICDSHVSHMRTYIIPEFPDVKFLLVDYVSGSVERSRSAQLSNGYAALNVLVDSDETVLNQFNATMGTTVVIDSSGIVRMNEDYKDGSKLYNTLEALP